MGLGVAKVTAYRGLALFLRGGSSFTFETTGNLFVLSTIPIACQTSCWSPAAAPRQSKDLTIIGLAALAVLLGAGYALIA